LLITLLIVPPVGKAGKLVATGGNATMRNPAFIAIKRIMEKYTALLIPAYLSGFFAVSLILLWPGLMQGWFSPADIMPLRGLAVFIIGGAICAVLTIFLARAVCYLFIETSGDKR
jgi:hypothetical protein